MSTVHVESRFEVAKSVFSPDIIRIAIQSQRAAGPRPATGTPGAMRVSAELDAVIALWVVRARRGLGTSRPGYRRNLL